MWANIQNVSVINPLGWHLTTFSDEKWEGCLLERMFIRINTVYVCLLHVLCFSVS